MGAILSYASVYFMSWMITQNSGKKWVILMAYPVYYFGALYPAFLLATRSKQAHLAVGIRHAILAWIFSGFSLWVLTGTTSLIFLILLLLCFLLGSLTGSYIALKRQIKKEAYEELKESTNSM